MATVSIVSVIVVCCVFFFLFVFFLMVRRPPRSTLDRSSAASDVYKRQADGGRGMTWAPANPLWLTGAVAVWLALWALNIGPVSYTHLRAHETVLDLVCRLLLEKKK